MFHYKLPTGGTLSNSARKFAADLEHWISAGAAGHDPARPGRMRDQAVLAAVWLPLLRYSADERHLQAWVTVYRDAIRANFNQSSQWSHGYWREGQGGDGTAHFRVFLEKLWHCYPTDRGTVTQFLDAAEHIGNWEPCVPPWFDWQQGLFRSQQMGTADISRGAEPVVNVPTHLYYAAMALTAYEMGGGAPYLELADCQGCKWAEAIAGKAELPLAIGPSGPLYNRLDFSRMESPHNRAMATSRRRATPLARARSLLSAGAIEVFLKLWQHLRNPLYKQAAETILDALSGELENTDSGDVAAAFRHYRNYTGDLRYDAFLLETIASLYPYRIEVLSLAAERIAGGEPVIAGNHPLRWLENGQSRQHNPITLSLVAEISGNERLATRAMELAHGYFLLARRYLPDGFAQGQATRSVCAVCRGDSRENGAGVVTEVFLPLMAAFEIQLEM